MGLLDNKVVVVLGADAIGAGIAARLAREGAAIALIDEDEKRAHSAAMGLGDHVRAWTARVIMEGAASQASIAGAVQEAAERLGGVHVLINNVLPAPFVAPLEEQPSAAFDAAFARVRAAAFAMQAALPCLRVSGCGRVINIGHRYGESVSESISAYNAAAWSLVGLTRSAALDWGRYQIAVNLLLPLADTPELRACHERRRNVLDLLIGQLPLGRAGDCVEDIGGAALFLASDAANFINGEVVRADGGQHIAGPVLNPARFL